jgi:3-oxoacyl-[acyl-carrier-protein] synthase-3
MKSPRSSASRLSTAPVLFTLTLSLTLLVLVLSATLPSSDAAAAFVAPKHHHHYSASASLSSSPPTATTTATSTTLTAKSGYMNCRPIGIGSAAPTTIISNADLEKVVETSDDWIQSRTGIAQRRVLLEKETIRGLAIAASQAALTMAGVDAADIDLVICATSSPDDMFGDAPSIASELGCTTETLAFDLTAACSGFLFGTVTAGKFLTNTGGKKTRALVIGADALSRWVDWDDRNSCILFGDGAGAIVLESTSADSPQEAGILGYAAHSNGKGYRDLNLG